MKRFGPIATLLPTGVQAVMKRGPSDHMLSVVKAGLAAVPCVGGPIASLIGDYIPTHTERAIERMLSELKARLEELERQNRLNLDSVSRDEFAEMFKTCYLTTVRTHQVEKLRGCANLIANALLDEKDDEKLSYTEADHFARCLDALSSGAINVLNECVSIAKSTGRRGNRVISENVRVDFGNLNRRMDMDHDLLMALVGELTSANLLHALGVPSVRTEHYSNYPLETTPLGYRFISKVLTPEVMEVRLQSDARSMSSGGSPT